ncbi:uncharacterized protein LOC144305362 [Canis aureus]
MSPSLPPCFYSAVVGELGRSKLLESPRCARHAGQEARAATRSITRTPGVCGGPAGGKGMISSIGVSLLGSSSSPRGKEADNNLDVLYSVAIGKLGIAPAAQRRQCRTEGPAQQPAAAHSTAPPPPPWRCGLQGSSGVGSGRGQVRSALCVCPRAHTRPHAPTHSHAPTRPHTSPRPSTHPTHAHAPARPHAPTCTRAHVHPRAVSQAVSRGAGTCGPWASGEPAAEPAGPGSGAPDSRLLSRLPEDRISSRDRSGAVWLPSGSAPRTFSRRRRGYSGSRAARTLTSWCPRGARWPRGPFRVLLNQIHEADLTSALRGRMEGLRPTAGASGPDGPVPRAGEGRGEARGGKPLSPRPGCAVAVAGRPGCPPPRLSAPPSGCDASCLQPPHPQLEGALCSLRDPDSARASAAPLHSGSPSGQAQVLRGGEAGLLPAATGRSTGHRPGAPQVPATRARTSALLGSDGGGASADPKPAQVA